MEMDMRPGPEIPQDTLHTLAAALSMATQRAGEDRHREVGAVRGIPGDDWTDGCNEGMSKITMSGRSMD